MPSSPPTSLHITIRHVLLAIVLGLIVSLHGATDGQANQLLSADGSLPSTPSPVVAQDEDGIAADDDVVLVLGYAAMVVLALGGLALLDRKPPHDDHDDDLEHPPVD